MNEQVTDINNIKRFTDQCFDKDNDKAASIVKGILDAQSPRISDISNEMEGNPLRWKAILPLITRLFKGF
jgi:hypothetical protein